MFDIEVGPRKRKKGTRLPVENESPGTFYKDNYDLRKENRRRHSQSLSDVLTMS